MCLQELRDDASQGMHEHRCVCVFLHMLYSVDQIKHSTYKIRVFWSEKILASVQNFESCSLRLGLKVKVRTGLGFGLGFVVRPFKSKRLWKQQKQNTRNLKLPTSHQLFSAVGETRFYRLSDNHANAEALECSTNPNRWKRQAPPFHS